MPATNSSETIIYRLAPLQGLSAEHRSAVIKQGKSLMLSAGQKINAAQEHGSVLCLVEGQLRLVEGGRPRVISAGDGRALEPVFAEGRLQDYAVALGRVVLLRLDDHLIKALQRGEMESGCEVEDLELNAEESALFSEIYEAAMSDVLELPALPEIAVRMQAAMKDPDIDIERLSRLAGMDLAVAGGLLKAASSAVYGTGKPVNSLRDAIVRLGLTVTRRLVVTIAVRQIFRTESALLRKRMQALWNRSVMVSALSFVIARRCQGFDPENALLAGLLHHVGAVPILGYAARYPERISDRDLDGCIDKLRVVLGELVVESWGLGSSVQEVIAECGHWHRERSGPPDVCDLVIVAQLYFLNEQGACEDLPRYDEVPAFRRLGLSAPDASGRLELIEEARGEIREMMNILEGSQAVR
jgi:HD-like signal output (HDOD) protein